MASYDAINVTPAALAQARRALDDAAGRLFVVEDTCGRDSNDWRTALSEYNRLLSEYERDKQTFNESLRVDRRAVLRAGRCRA